MSTGDEKRNVDMIWWEMVVVLLVSGSVDEHQALGKTMKQEKRYKNQKTALEIDTLAEERREEKCLSAPRRS
jgi:hypothetical protein